MADEQRLPLREWQARWGVRQRELVERARDPFASFTREDFDELCRAQLLRRIEHLEHELESIRRDLP